ncbi:carotenoid 1,2-hydratase [Sandarakinorhabdus sp.]|uniref:lipocalin-like domain-containing protein n=1 Tax=Sandarakinorhabdus sp. TaxID=1916663 RepID=UPI00286E22DD|nr:carotenoid 1,2-hydratase [Sandarakinorhabdus sp.]
MMRVLALPLLAAMAMAAAPMPNWAVVRPGVPIVFPRDHGAHPDFRTEWWYLTGWLQTADGKPLGFQVTFFRTRPAVDQANPSRFAPRQILFAHAALSDPANARLLHGQRLARAGFGLAETATADMDVRLEDWYLRRQPGGTLVTRASGPGFALDLAFTPTQSPLLQGRAGYSQKGPNPAEASHYYSLPQLKVSGNIVRGGRVQRVTGTAWMDREWSSTLLNARAIGWDWLGLNMDDGGALTLFRVRDKAGKAVWAGGSWRPRGGASINLLPSQIGWQDGPVWRSVRTGARYPVSPRVTVTLPARTLVVPVTPLMADSELDSRRGGGPVYWEGAVRVPGGKGYLEMTGYAAPLKM